MNFSDFYVRHRTRKGYFLNQIDRLTDWKPIGQQIHRHCTLASVVVGCPVYPDLLLFKMLLMGLWHGSLGDEAVEEMVKINRQVEGCNLLVKPGCRVNASITHSPRKIKAKPTYEVVSGRERRDDEAGTRRQPMRVVEVTQPGVDAESRWQKKVDKAVLIYKTSIPL